MDSAPTHARLDGAGLAAGAITLGMDFVYVSVIRSQGEGDLDRTRVQLVAASLAVVGVVALAGWTVQDPGSGSLCSVPRGSRCSPGLPGILSIGFPVFIAGVLLLVSAGRAAGEVQPAEAWAIVPLASGAAVLAAAAVVATTV